MAACMGGICPQSCPSPPCLGCDRVFIWPLVHPEKWYLDRIAELEAENAGLKTAYDHCVERELSWMVRSDKAEAVMVDATHLATEMSQKLIDAEAYVAQAEAQRDECHASAADWYGQALLLQDELAALKDVAEAMEEFIDGCAYHVRCGKTVHYGGPRIDVAARAEEGGE